MKRNEFAILKEWHVILERLTECNLELIALQDLRKEVQNTKEQIQNALSFVAQRVIKDNVKIFVMTIWTESIPKSLSKFTTITKKIELLEIISTNLNPGNTSYQLDSCIENINRHLKSEAKQAKISTNIPIDSSLMFPVLKAKNKIQEVLRDISDLSYNIIDYNDGKKLLAILLN